MVTSLITYLGRTPGWRGVCLNEVQCRIILERLLRTYYVVSCWARCVCVIASCRAHPCGLPLRALSANFQLKDARNSRTYLVIEHVCLLSSSCTVYHVVTALSSFSLDHHGAQIGNVEVLLVRSFCTPYLFIVCFSSSRTQCCWYYYCCSQQFISYELSIVLPPQSCNNILRVFLAPPRRTSVGPPTHAPRPQTPL